MKIALLLSGQPRTVEQTYPSFRKHFAGIPCCDMFVFTSQPYPSDLIPLYKYYCVQKQFPFHQQESVLQHVFCSNLDALRSYLQQVYGWKRAWEGMEQSLVRYDFVIRARPDIEYIHNITLNMFHLDKMNMIPRKVDYDKNQSFTDIFFAGPYVFMKKVMNLFDDLLEMNLTVGDEWTKRLPEENVVALGGRHCPETILSTYVADFLKLPYRYTDMVLEDLMFLRRTS